MAEMTFWDHLDELRRVLFRLIGVWLLLAILFFAFMPYLFDEVILAPCQDDFIFYTFLHKIGNMLNLTGDFFNQHFEVKLVNINLAAPFFIHISISFWMSVIFSVPYLLFELWHFVRPALYKKELKYVGQAFFLGSLFFFIGILLGYFIVFPLTLRFLSTYSLSALIGNQISLNSYMDNFMMLVLMMGLVFELPLLTWLFSLLGILKRNMLRRFRRYAIVGIFILAAVITPTGDPFTLAVVAIPLCLLYELSILLIKEKKDDE